jgi:uncharacterized protein YcfL
MKYSLSILALAALALGGCYSVNTVETGAPAAQRNVISDRRVVWDNTLNGKLSIGEIIAGTSSDNLRRLQVDVANKYAYALNFDYKVEWTDANGMKLTTPLDGWKRLHLEAHEKSVIAVTATTPQAVDFVIKFQESKGSNTIF